ncbi:DEDDy 3'-5' exonuclease [Acanthamoeba castellanii medusavirus]|uniref:DEDDy 3'-5' exonuclease n=1 Tax=Acanthamoeba castellanii medusavirus J1 TaxID=3114988 RepID=A0A3T1CWG1_9VIRU|nr:DEDDy 3'-5' exonuclease [Acanthamoeba castellanii medusavirus]BBI30167.1 DEDDy 3'-5' exonuclease [Acanthamoeba castellanii medusavirus J1]
MQTTAAVAKDATEAVARAKKGVEENGGWAVVPLCPEGVKQREVAQGLQKLGMTGTRMGTGGDRTLFAVRGEAPPPLLFRHLSPATRACLATHAGVHTFQHAHANDLFVTLPGVDAGEWLDLLSRILCELGGEKRFLDLHRMTVTRIAAVAAAGDAMAEWRALPEPSPKDCKPDWPVCAVRGGGGGSGSIYQPANDGRCFVSVDMSAANFQVLRNFGIFFEPSWEALVSRPDVALSDSSAEYVSRAKRLRMLALSTPTLRPNLQRARWSRVMLQAFDTVVEAGHADGYHDFAAFNSDEVIIHTDNEDDAVAKCAAIAALLQREMPEWRFKCSAYMVLRDACGQGYLRVDLHTKHSTRKCIPLDYYQQHVREWFTAPSSPPRVTPPWPDSRCIAFVTDAERRLCEQAIVDIIIANYMGIARESLQDYFRYGHGVGESRTNDLIQHTVEELGRGIVGYHDTGRAMAVWHLVMGDVDKYRARAWPVPLPPDVCLVITAAECDAAVEHLARHHAVIAMDCEGIIPSGGKVDLSLVQMSGDDGVVYLFDMLSPDAPWFDLRSLLGNPGITKVAHDGRGDLSVLFLRYGLHVQGFFDTQIAYSIAHDLHKAVGLNIMLAGVGVAVNEHKSAISKQMSRDRLCWHRRPLTSRMNEYAACDVRNHVDAYRRLVGAMSPEQREVAWALSAQRAKEAATPQINNIG